jgi:hypothetical protein
MILMPESQLVNFRQCFASTRSYACRLATLYHCILRGSQRDRKSGQRGSCCQGRHDLVKRRLTRTFLFSSYLRRTISPYPPRSSSGMLTTKRPIFSLSLTSMIRSRTRISVVDWSWMRERTYEDAEDLVHFVDSASALQPFTTNPPFDDLEQSLRSFVLVKRSNLKSKLQPVSTYLSKLLADIELLVTDSELQRARDVTSPTCFGEDDGRTRRSRRISGFR